MKRRAFLSVAVGAASAGCMAGLPGPTGPRNPPNEPANDPREEPDRRPLVVESFRFADAGDGNLLATVVVRNRSDQTRSATVVGTVEVDGDRSVETAEGVEVPAGGQVAVDLTYDVPYEEFDRNGSFQPRLE
ncbi:transcriptional initiation protein Tat [Halobium salinum]|uniref:Transcriptional initiation protein Tat n=1 Tax=Halobium salinum TaxID=1364940 RepID=A0ABD5PEA5_9EURY|nr:transcriptional initiation protein Tat [Halobium salinum]